MELNENKTIEHKVADILHVDNSQVRIAKPRKDEPIEVRVESYSDERIQITEAIRAGLCDVLPEGALVSITHPQPDDVRVQPENDDLALAA